MGRISARVFSMNFLRSLLEKGHQVSPQGKRRDQILEALSISQAAPRGTAVSTSPQALAFCPKNPGSPSDSATWTLCMFCKTPAEQCWWEVGRNRGWGRIPSWDLHWDWKLFLVWWPGGGCVPNGCPFCLGGGAGDPWAPSSSPRCPGRRRSPSLRARHVHQRSFADQCFSSAPSSVAGRWPAGYSQPGYDFISAALWAGVSLLFFTSSLIYSCGMERKAQPAALAGDIAICCSC